MNLRIPKTQYERKALWLKSHHGKRRNKTDLVISLQKAKRVHQGRCPMCNGHIIDRAMEYLEMRVAKGIIIKKDKTFFNCPYCYQKLFVKNT